MHEFTCAPHPSHVCLCAQPQGRTASNPNYNNADNAQAFLSGDEYAAVPEEDEYGTLPEDDEYGTVPGTCARSPLQ